MTPEVREVVQVVEEIIKVPVKRVEERPVIKQVPVVRVAQRVVEVPV